MALQDEDDERVVWYGRDCPVVKVLEGMFGVGTQTGADGVMVSRNLTVVMRGAVAERYENSEPLKTALLRWEQTGVFEPGSYDLHPLPAVIDELEEPSGEEP